MKALSEYETEQLLREAGLPVVEGREVGTWDEVVAAARALGYPVVLKVSGVAHKTEVGGVRLDLQDEGALRAAYEALRPLSRRFLVQRMVQPGLEMIVGGRRDPVFGPVVIVGVGGVTVEVLGDVAVRLCPVDEAEAGRMLDELKARVLLGPFRGRPAVDRKALCRFVAGLSRLMVEHPEMTEVDCNPVIARHDGVVAVDAVAFFRDTALDETPSEHYMAGEGIEGFFCPSSVAVVGASEKPSKGGAVVLRNMLTHGFRGRLYAVHPTLSSVQGVPAYPNVAALPEAVELVVAVVPRDRIASVVRDCGKRRVRNLIVVSGGFADVGGQGLQLQEEVIQLAREAGIRLMGPNSIGTIDTRSGVVTSITTLPGLSAGGASYVGQTGVFASGFAAMMSARPGLGISRVACLGNKADVCETDILACYGRDPNTRSIGMYLEGVKRPALFIEVLRRVAQEKPVVILKGGTSRAGAEAVASHTGALTGERQVFEAAVRQAGAFVASDFDDLHDIVGAFAISPTPKGNGLGVVSISGVGCVLAADRAEAEGVVIPPLNPATEAAIRSVVPEWAPVRNPVDIWSAIEARGAETAYGEISEAVLSQDDVYALLLIMVWIPESRFDLVGLAARLRRAHEDKPVVVAFMGGYPDEVRTLTDGLEANGVPAFGSVSRAIRVLASLTRRGLESSLLQGHQGSPII